MELIIIDHHPHGPHGKAAVIKSETPENFYAEVRKYLEPGCDLVATDADPDGLLSTVIFRIGYKSIAPVQFIGEITPELLAEFQNKGIKRILSLDVGKWYKHFDRFSQVVLLNPKDSGILVDVNTSEIIYQSLLQKTDYLRDLNALAIVCDYCVSGAMESIMEVVNAYPELFKDVKQLYDNETLTPFTALDTSLGKLSEIMWGGTIIDGKSGALHLVELLLEHPFSLEEFTKGAGNPAVQHLRSAGQRFLKAVNEEMAKEPEDHGILRIYEVREKPSGIGRYVSNKLSHNQPDKIIAVRQKSDKGYKYSIRRVLPEIDLGKVLTDMGVGGGHPRAAGAFAANAKEFEKLLALRCH